ncbi:MAG: hypothetical protein ACYCUF_00470 [Acidimicrobiales bacterium]|jgi:hypothetical protein|nr:hypothetical protein [Actinomycetota bacterium]MDA8185430.1 hypothetical protein [Actinomycetota bacterium]
MRVAAGFLTTIGWAAYLGGALVMELVWRPLQRDLPPGQTGVLCQRMGRRYRWVALFALGVAGASWIAARLAGNAPVSVAPWQVVLAGASWAALASLVLAMGALVHPLSHLRSRAGASSEERAAARARRLRAMRLMNAMLRVELCIALLATALVAWPAPSTPLITGGVR